MKKLFWALMFSFFALLLPLPVQAQSFSDRPKNEVEIRGVFSIPSGDANFSGNGAPDSTIDFARDSDFKNELGFEVRYAYRSSNGKHKFVGDYDSTNWERTRTFNRSFTFLGETYLANANINSELKLQTFRAMYSYRWGNDKIRIGPMVNLGLIKASLDLTGTTNRGTRSTEGSITKLAATLGYDLDYDPAPRLNLFHNLGAIAFQGQHLFGTEGGVKFYATQHLGILGGYKYSRYKLVDNQNFLTVRQHGPFFGGSFRF